MSSLSSTKRLSLSKKSITKTLSPHTVSDLSSERVEKLEVSLRLARDEENKFPIEWHDVTAAAPTLHTKSSIEG